MFIYGAFVFLQVYAFTELMDRSKYAWIWETLKTIFGLSILLQSNDWFGLSQYTSLAVPVLTGYFVLSLMVCLYFVLKENIEIRNVK
jgi:alkylglycerol monooxygenase